MLRFSLLAVLLSFTAAATADDFSYNWLQAGYGWIEFDDIDVDGDGLGIGGSFEINDEFFIFGNYAQADLDFGIDTTSWNAGFGYNTALTDVVDLFATVSYEYVDIDVPAFGSQDENGFGVGVGMRFWAMDGLELNGSINYVDVGDDDTALNLGGLYSFTPRFALGLATSFSDDVSSYQVFGRFYFEN
ncbi:MAG: outer membrane beta-barrel protein [Woeseiaceae bacterium]|jgi:hypothetical protein|nr:outer membrane beta-barrel protein [Woeseiaceae bacterium]